MYEPIDVDGEALSLDYGVVPDQATKSVIVTYSVHKNGQPVGNMPTIPYDREELEEMGLLEEHQYTSDKLEQAAKIMVRMHIKDLRDWRSGPNVDESTAMEWLEQAVKALT